MEPEEFKKQLGEVLAEVYETVVNKNIGYSKGEGLGSVYETADTSGVLPEQVLTTRINEKMIRFRNILLGEGEDKVGEPLYETITDVCGQAALLSLLVKPDATQETIEEPPPNSITNWFKNLFTIKQ